MPLTATNEGLCKGFVGAEEGQLINSLKKKKGSLRSWVIIPPEVYR